jgi:hypothetical protein
LESPDTVKFGVYLCHSVPGHAGVRGDERADRLVGTAVISDGRALDQPDVFHALR